MDQDKELLEKFAAGEGGVIKGVIEYPGRILKLLEAAGILLRGDEIKFMKIPEGDTRAPVIKTYIRSAEYDALSIIDGIEHIVRHAQKNDQEWQVVYRLNEEWHRLQKRIEEDREEALSPQYKQAKEQLEKLMVLVEEESKRQKEAKKADQEFECNQDLFNRFDKASQHYRMATAKEYCSNEYYRFPVWSIGEYCNYLIDQLVQLHPKEFETAEIGIDDILSQAEFLRADGAPAQRAMDVAERVCIVKKHAPQIIAAKVKELEAQNPENDGLSSGP